MSDLSKYKQVNWIDGMKVNKNHFIEQENYFTARINDSSNKFLDNNNYGLLSNSTNGSSWSLIQPEHDLLCCAHWTHWLHFHSINAKSRYNEKQIKKQFKIVAEDR